MNSGLYRLRFHVKGKPTVELFFDLVTNRGIHQLYQKQFLIQKEKENLIEADFIVDERLFVEPRLKFVSKAQPVKFELLRLEIKRKGYYFPWKFIILKSLFFWNNALSAVQIFFLFPTRNGTLCSAYFLLLSGSLLILSRVWATEDSYITLRYADNLVKGFGPVLTLGKGLKAFLILSGC